MLKTYFRMARLILIVSINFDNLVLLFIELLKAGNHKVSFHLSK